MPTHSQPRSHDVDWLAFCFAVGELSEDETAAFEARLDTDQIAREALARAVHLTQTVAAAESEGWAQPTGATSVPQPSATHVSLARRTQARWSARLAWIAIGGVAAVLLAVAFIGAPEQEPAAAYRHRLASAWTQTRAQLALEADPAIWPALDAISDFQDDLASDFTTAEVSETPSWLTAAVRGQMSAAPHADSLNDGPVEN